MPNFSSDYIIRIYRFDKKRLHHVVGTAEEVGVKGKKAFTNLEELWEILNRPKERENLGEFKTDSRKDQDRMEETEKWCVTF